MYDYEHIKFRHLDVKNGLLHNDVTAIYQDSKGFMWFGTVLGLCKYDGEFFEYYSSENINTDFHLTNNFVTALGEYDNKLFVGTFEGLNVIDLKTNAVTKITKITNLASLKMNYSNSIVSMLPISKDTLWIGGHNGFIKVKIQGDSLLVLTDGVDFYDNRRTFAFAKHKKNNMLVGTMSGLMYYNTTTKSILRLDKLIPEVGATQITSIHPIGIDTFLVTGAQGYYKLMLHEKFEENHKYSIEISRSFDPVIEGKFENTFLMRWVKDIVLDNYNNLWVATPGGLNIVEQHTTPQKIHTYVNVPGCENCLHGDKILSIYTDKSGVIYIGTQGSGLNIFEPYGFKFQPIRDLEAADKFSVLCAKKDVLGNMWIQLNSSTLYYYVTKQNRFIKISGLGYHVFSSMDEDAYHNIWLTSNTSSTSTGGLFLLKNVAKFHKTLNPNDLELEHFSNETFPDFGRDINFGLEVFADKVDTTLWFISNNGGVYHLKYQNNEKLTLVWEIENIERKKYGLSGKRINSVDAGKDGRLFFTVGNEGVFEYNRDHQIFNELFNFKNYKLPPSVNSCDFTFQDSKNRFWIGTYGAGVLQIDGNDPGKYMYYSNNTGLKSNIVASALEDNKGQIWLATSQGISVVSGGKKQVVSYTVNDGLQDNIFSKKVACKMNDSTLFFGGMNGFNIFHTDEVEHKRNKFKPPTVITRIRINGDEFFKQIDNKESIKNSQFVDTLILKSYQNNITFRIATLSFASPEKNKFTYKLENYEKYWNLVTGGRSFVEYNDLKPGEYTFMVRSANADGVWNEDFTTVYIHIDPPFYYRWWFILGCLTIFSLLVWSFSYVRTIRIKKQNLLLEKKVKEQTKELNAQTDQLKHYLADVEHKNGLLQERQLLIEKQSEKLKVQHSALEATNEVLVKQSKDLEKQRDELQDLNNTKTKLFSIIAHDLVNPFNVILGFTEIMYKRFDNYPPEKLKGYIKNTYDSSKTLYALLENLLNWSRSQRGKIAFEPKQIVFYELVSSVTDFLRPLASQKNIQLQIGFDPSVVVFADEHMLHTVLRNLITNAIKFTQNGFVRVHAECNGAKTIVKIEDNGVGMNAELCKSLFAFNTAQSQKGTHGEKGTGLGLVICKDFIEKHNGEIFAQSVEGEGTVIVFTLQNEMHNA